MYLNNNKKSAFLCIYESLLFYLCIYENKKKDGQKEYSL